MLTVDVHTGMPLKICQISWFIALNTGISEIRPEYWYTEGNPYIVYTGRRYSWTDALESLSVFDDLDLLWPVLRGDQPLQEVPNLHRHGRQVVSRQT